MVPHGAAVSERARSLLADASRAETCSAPCPPKTPAMQSTCCLPQPSVGKALFPWGQRLVVSLGRLQVTMAPVQARVWLQANSDQCQEAQLQLLLRVAGGAAKVKGARGLRGRVV